MTIFIGGSRHFKKLNDAIIERLNNIIDKGYNIAIGDADGADCGIQEFFAGKQYQNINIYCSGSTCRNNLLNWPIKNIEVDPKIKGRNFYMVKDYAMAKASDYGFMLWDGKSPGTMNNILNLLKDQKTTLVYYSPLNNFFTVNDIVSLDNLLENCKPDQIEDMNKKISFSVRYAQLSEPEQLELIN